MLVFSFIQNSYQHNTKIICDSEFSCVVSGVYNTSELIQLRKMISSGVYVKFDETKINVSQIKAIKFVNSSFNEVSVGFFDERLFKELEKIDLSGVGLTKFDIQDAYVGKVLLVDIQYNNLKTIGMIESSNKTQNKVKKIDMNNNNWNCVELLLILTNLTNLKIFPSASTDSTKTNTTNIHGIKCICSDENHIIRKLNQMIEKLDAYEVKDQKIKGIIQKTSEQVEKMETRFTEVNKEMSAALLDSQQKNEACNHSETMDLIINATSDNIKDFMYKKNNFFVDSNIFKIVDASYGGIFKGYGDITMIIRNLKKIIVDTVDTAAIKTEPQLLWKVLKISLISLCLVVLSIGIFMMRTRIRSLCSNSTLENHSVSYSTLNHL